MIQSTGNRILVILEFLFLIRKQEHWEGSTLLQFAHHRSSTGTLILKQVFSKEAVAKKLHSKKLSNYRPCVSLIFES